MTSFQWLERIFRLLLPPASREHVLGDLHERCKSPRQYLAEAISVLAPVVISRIRRTTDFQVLLMEAFAVYLSFSANAWWLGAKTFLYDHAGFARLSIPTTVTVAGLLFCNAYSDLDKQSSVVRPILQSAVSIALAFLGQAVLFDTSPDFAVPFGIMLYGSCTGFLLLATLRMLFPPILGRQAQRALLIRPPVSQKPDLIALRVRLHEFRQGTSEVRPTRRWRVASTCGVVLVLAVFIFSPAWHRTLIGPRIIIFGIAVLVMICCLRIGE
jgi:hypothetical protein